MLISRNKIFLALVIVFLGYLFQRYFISKDDNFHPNYCVYYCFIRKGGTHESCSKECNVPLNLSPRST